MAPEGEMHGLRAAKPAPDRAEHRIEPPEELDPVTAGELAAALAACPASHHLVVDFAGVTFCDSSGMRALLDAHRRQDEAGGTVRLVNVSPQVRRVFEIARVDELLLGPSESSDQSADVRRRGDDPANGGPGV